MLNNALVAVTIGVFLYLGSVFLTGCSTGSRLDDCSWHTDKSRNITVFICDAGVEKDVANGR